MPHTTDAEHLQFIFNRLKHVYGENPNYDYMLRFQEIITKLSEPAPSKPGVPKLEHPDLGGHLSDAIRDVTNHFLGKVISTDLSEAMANAIIEQVGDFSKQWQESQAQKQQGTVDAGTTEIVKRRPYLKDIIQQLENTINATTRENDLVFPMKQGRHILAYLKHMAETYLEEAEEVDEPITKKPRPESFKAARIFADGKVKGPECCGKPMADDGDCGQGCCDDYKCESCGYTTRVEWPD